MCRRVCSEGCSGRSLLNESATFIPFPNSPALLNLRRFVGLCRNELAIFGAIDFDADRWDVGTALNSDNKRGNRSLHFCNLATSPQRIKKKLPLSSGYSDFAKGYIRYMQAIEPASETPISTRLRALQTVEQALLAMGESCPTRITSTTFDNAASLAKKLFGVGKAYQIGRALSRLSKFIDENRLSRVRTSWTSFLVAPTDFGVKLGREFEERRAEKLPVQEHLEALGEAFHRATKPRDLLVSSVLGLLVCQPGRVSEVVRLSVDCLVPRNDGKPGFLLRYWAAKGGGAILKPVSATMSGVAEEAVRRLTAYSAPARLVAQHYESKPGTLFLSTKLSYLRSKPLLSVREVDQILWGGSHGSGKDMTEAEYDQKTITAVLTWCSRNKVGTGDDLRSSPGEVCAMDVPRIGFGDLERRILRMLPAGFPVFHKLSRLKYSEALCISRIHEYNPRKNTLVCMIRPVAEHEIARAVDESSPRGMPSLFESTGVCDSEGRPIVILTHQLRHFLNTIAQSANMDAFDIAAWSGRKNVAQNSAYDHVSSAERIEEMRESVGRATGAFAPAVSKKTYIPILRSEWLSKRVQAGHTTDLGYCVHDFTMMPCPKFSDHISCDEHVVVKGNVDVERRVRLSLDENQTLVANALAALNAGRLSAKIWLETHEANVERLQQIVRLLDDPQVGAGALIRLTGSESPSRVGEASRARVLLDAAVTSSGSLESIQVNPDVGSVGLLESKGSEVLQFEEVDQAPVQQTRARSVKARAT